jgi:hypothetical protein
LPPVELCLGTSVSGAWPSLAPIDLRTTGACDGVSFCGCVTPEDGMGAEDRVLEAEANGFAGRVEVIEGPSGRRAWPGKQASSCHAYLRSIA